MNRSILIIDDEASIRQSLSGALSDEGYQVMSAPNAAQGMELIRKISPDVVIMDIWMPDVDGLTALNEIRKQGIEIPIIMMSGHGTIETAVKATKLGAFDFVEKPVELDRVLVLIRNALSARDLISGKPGASETNLNPQTPDRGIPSHERRQRADSAGGSHIGIGSDHG